MTLRLLLLVLYIYPFLVSAQDIQQRIILIGDAGEINQDQTILIPAAAALVLPGRTTTYFLGDNIYPDGMALDSSGREVSIGILKSQYTPFLERQVPVYFMAGNHDWDKSGPQGLLKVEQQAAYINKLKDKNLHFVPAAGTLGPVVTQSSGKLLTVVYDSEYWLYPHHEKSKAVIQSEKQHFLHSLDSITSTYSDKILLLLSHHPMRSYGEHGLHFSITDHIFPLRKLWKGLYLPLPIVGSLYPLLRSSIFSSGEDLTHRQYRELIDSVTTLMAKRNNVIYASGHDHGLQLIREGSFTQIVSGSGAKTSSIGHANDLHYRHGAQGFTVVDVYTDGRAKISYFINQAGDVNKDYEDWLIEKPTPSQTKN
ncbi:MAG: metallophosphoesterase [Sphingobacterium sp.]|uniref:metallophosphoesterase n=1 Tax=Sphingobacterium sp. JB170 TaxID=1434842 RepID=UPI00097E7EBF|nr:metallophosphoesterase [Sphingobacterium sp. JB170]SJN49549.1 Surface antigen (D15) precursor [Sphingobacterium sp. JB170]